MHKSLETAVSVVVQTNTFMASNQNYRQWACRVTVIDRDGSFTYLQNERPDTHTSANQLAGELMGVDTRDLCYDHGITVLTLATRAGKKSDLFSF